MRSLFNILAILSPLALLASQDLVVPADPMVFLIPSANIENTAVVESSGAVKSRRHKDVYWTINDSGNTPTLYALHSNGKTVGNEAGIRVQGAVNLDWEDIATDDAGNLIIADTGNNDNKRQNLRLIWTTEPDPKSDTEVASMRQILVHYPEQTAFPPDRADRNFDCEAIFFAAGKVYLLTKHRGDTATVLYQLDTMSETESNTLTRVERFEIGAQVTSADCSPDGKRLAILTYKAIWVFETEAPEKSDWLSGSVHWLPIMAGQAEAICWVNDSELLITNEQRNIFTVPTSKLKQLR